MKTHSETDKRVARILLKLMTTAQKNERKCANYYVRIDGAPFTSKSRKAYAYASGGHGMMAPMAA